MKMLESWPDQATSHYLNQWRLVYWRIYASLGLKELTNIGKKDRRYSFDIDCLAGLKSNNKNI